MLVLGFLSEYNPCCDGENENTDNQPDPSAHNGVWFGSQSFKCSHDSDTALTSTFNFPACDCTAVKPTRRFWEANAVAVVPALGAVLFNEPLLLVGTAGIVGWLLASQLAFVSAVSRFDESLDIVQTPTRAATFVDEPVAVLLDTDSIETPLDVMVTARPSPALEADGVVEIRPGESTTFLVRSSIAGTHRLRQPRLNVTGPAGLFTERFERGQEAELRVETRPLTTLHIGQGETALTQTVGEHRFETSGSGTVPAQLREYESGEPASRIDWHTTARLGETYVRAFEAEVAQPILLVFDARLGLDDEILPGPLDHLRTAADIFVTTAQRLGDPIGCYGIDDNGIRQLTPLSSAKRDYERTRHRLQDLTGSSRFRRTRLSSPLQHRTASYDTTTRFGEVLQVYAATAPILDSESKPLKAAVRTALAKRSTGAHVVLFTDDTDRAGIREAVAEARRTGDITTVSVFIAPSPLFDTDPLTDSSTIADRYLDFEQFRRELTRIDRVTAYEVAPESRIQMDVGPDQ